MARLRSYAHRPPHLGPYPLEKLARLHRCPPLGDLPAEPALSFRRPKDPQSIVNAMRQYQATLDATREGLIKREIAEIPTDPQERANHLKSFGYFCDASMVGICEIPPECWRDAPLENPDVDDLAAKLRTHQPKSLAAGIDVIMAGLRAAMDAPPTDCSHHTHAIVFLYDHPRAPKPDEAGCDWLDNALAHRACLRGSETAVSLAAYIRSLGYQARAHSAMASDVHMNRLAVKAGLAAIRDGRAVNPFLVVILACRWSQRRLI